MSDPGPAFLLAPGAGAPSSHPRMRSFARLLGSIGQVESLDYPYALEGDAAAGPAAQAYRRASSGPGRASRQA